MKYLFRPLLLVISFVTVAFFCKRQTDGFTIAKICSDLPYNAEWNVLQNEIPPALLDQPFTYLSKGAQAFVFASEDGKYVLKLFRHDHMRAHLWTSFFQTAGDQRRRDKLSQSFSSYKIAADDLKSQCGLVFVHLNKTNHLHKKLQIIDKLGIIHELDADKIEFLIQKKAELLYPSLQQSISLGQIEESKVLLGSLVDLLKELGAKGIADKDPNLETNFGVLEGQAVQIDIGRFSKNPSQDAHGELMRTLDPLRFWLQERFPALETYLMEKVNET